MMAVMVMTMMLTEDDHYYGSGGGGDDDYENVFDTYSFLFASRTYLF